MRNTILFLASASLFACQSASPGTPSDGARDPSEQRPTEPFRREHAEIREHLAHVGDLVGGLRAGAPRAREGMASVADFLVGHIVPHAAAEERSLYPAVDARVGGSEPFTATMRHDHRIVARRIEDLSARAARPDSDPVAFARRADELLGLLAAHFEKEEEVLLAILDRSMSAGEFRREVLERAHPR